MSNREELLKKARRKVLLNKAKAKIKGSEQSRDTSRETSRDFFSVSPEGLATSAKASLQAVNDALPFGELAQAGLDAGKAGYDTLTGEEGFSENLEKYQKGRASQRAELTDKAPLAYYGALAPTALASPVKGGANVLEAYLNSLARPESDASDVAGETGVAALLGKAGKVLGGAPDAAKKVKDVALSRGSKALGFTAPIEKKLGTDTVRDFTETALDNKTLTSLASPSTMLERSQKIQEGAGETIGGVSSKLEELGTKVQPDEVIANIDRKFGQQYSQPTSPQLQRQYESFLKGLEESNTDPATINLIKKNLADAGYTGGKPSEGASAALSRNLRGGLEEGYTEAVGETAKRSGDKELLREYLEAKQTYGPAKQTSSALESKAISDDKRGLVGLTDYNIIGGAVAGGSSLGSTGGLLAGKKFLESKGNQISAVALKNLSDALDLKGVKVPAKYGQQLVNAANRGNSALKVSHHLLMQTDPEYRKSILDKEESEED